MTAVRDRLAALGLRRAGQRFRRPGIEVVRPAVLLAGVVALAPAWWWHHLSAVITGPGWRWPAILLTASGGITLGREAVLRWRRGGPGRGRPVAERVPLFGHVTVLLLLAAAVATTVGTGLWLAFGRPNLAAAGRPTAWSVENTFDAIKIMLAIVAGIGGVVALTVAYRKQDHGEAAERRENTKLFNDRFGRAAEQLGSGQAAVRLARVYAMTGLADDWVDGRQTCIDVLCAYLRLPYAPPSAPLAPGSAPAGLPAGGIVSSDDGRICRQEQQVRHTVLALIGERLRPAKGTDDRPRWHGNRFNLRSAVLDGADLHSVDVSIDTVLDFSFATFAGGTVDFSFATFAGGTVDFSFATFAGGTVDFGYAGFSGGVVDFSYVGLSGGLVDFRYATFSGGAVNFSDAKLFGGTVDFLGATFTGGMVHFSDAEFIGGTVDFLGATFARGTVSFRGVTIPGGMVDFRDAEFVGGMVDFSYASCASGTVDLRAPADWSVPPIGIDGSMPGALWPSPEHLAKITSV